MKIKFNQKNPFIAKESLFVKSFKLAKSSPAKTGLMILFDALFLISIFALYKLAHYISPIVAGPMIAPTLATSILYIILSLIYYLIAIFVYSFFKYSVLDSIKSLFTSTESSFRRLAEFYSLNIIIVGIFFAVALAADFILRGIQQGYAPYVFVVLAIPYLLFLYMTVNVSHSLFYQGSSVKESLKGGFNATFTKIRAYRETVLVMIILALVLWILLSGVGYLVRLLGAKNFALYLTLYFYFSQASIIAFDLALYIAILVNRISFYSLTENR